MKTNHKHFGKTDRSDVLFFCFLAVLSVFLLWRCRFGYASNDEAFYLTIPYRLLQGDALLMEEWHLSQLSGLLLVGAVWLYTTLTGGTEGILLAMRCLCVLAQTAAAGFLYCRLKGYSRLGAAAAALSFVLFIPLSICALSYNSMGILFLTLSQVLLITGKTHSSYLLAGLCFAASVLCCPYLLMVFGAYLLLVMCVLVRNQLRHVSCDTPSPWTVRGALWFAAGSAIAAGLFALFVLSRAPLDKILLSLKQMMYDPEHLTYSLVFKIREYRNCILHATSWSAELYTCLAVTAAVCVLDRKRREHRVFYTICAGIEILILMVSHYLARRSLNYVMWSVNLWAPFLMLLSRNKKNWGLFTLLWLPGIAYSFCMNMASNNIFYAISSGSSVATVGTLVMLGMYLRELRQEEAISWKKYLPLGILCLTLALQLSTEAVLRYRNIYWSSGLETQTETLQDGVDKGLVVTEAWRDSYFWDLKVVETVDSFGGEQVLYLSETTWYYLQGNGKNASYSAWLSGVSDYTLNQLEAYYAINPQKLPDVVYTEEQYAHIAAEFCQRFGYEIASSDLGFILLPKAEA